MTPAPAPRTGTGGYRALLGRLDAWFESGRRRHGAVIPCRAGCSACCHGPFDITVADVELLREGVAALDERTRAEVKARAATLLETMEAVEPGWAAPHAVASLGEERFDALIERFADVPCPLLDDAGRCRIYHSRPLVCRLIGLGMLSPIGRVIGNTCPIQDRFPLYAELAPEPFDLEALELEELECQRAAARRLFGDAAAADFETTITAAILDPHRP